MTLEDLLDRSPADNRGIKLSADVAAAHNTPGQKPKRFRPSYFTLLKCCRPVIAGEANKPGGIYDRLSQQDSYTGVYRERFIQQPSSPNEFR